MLLEAGPTSEKLPPPTVRGLSNVLEYRSKVGLPEPVRRQHFQRWKSDKMALPGRHAVLKGAGFVMFDLGHQCFQNVQRFFMNFSIADLEIYFS